MLDSDGNDDDEDEEEEDKLGKLMILRSTTLSLMASCWSAAIKCEGAPTQLARVRVPAAMLGTLRAGVKEMDEVGEGVLMSV